MFNLIVSGGDWVSGTFDVSSGRIFEFTTDALKSQFNENGKPNFRALMSLPTLFMDEGTEDELARIGSITGIDVTGKAIEVTCKFDLGVPPIQNRRLVELARDLDLHDWEFSRNHWAVKSADLCRVLLRQGLERRVSPRVFRIAEHEIIQSDLLSVMMPFDARFNPVYSTLQELCSDLGLKCARADDIWENDAVMQDVVSLIDRSRIVVADCTSRNPNVFYEIGIAHTLGRDVLMITQVEADVPFDLRHLRFVKYLNNAEGRGALKNALRMRINSLV